MSVFNYPNIKDIKDNVACIGYFDGVHLGHQALIKKTVELAKKYNIKAYAISFDGDFNSLMHKGKEITSLDEKINLLYSYGIEDIIFIKFDNEFASTSPEDFINKYLNNFKINTLICGFDFSYGFKGQGNVDSLLNSKDRNFKVEVIPKLEINGQKISSTLIKNELLKGNDIKGYIGR